MTKPTFVIGDVHGCYHTLQNLIAKLPTGADLIFVGDLCDNGLYTKEVIEFVISGGYRCVLGNHDVHMRMHLKNALNGVESKWSTHEDYKGYNTVKSYRNAPETLVDEHIAWLHTLPASIEIDRYLITHGFALPFYKKEHPKKELIMRVNRLSNDLYNEYYDEDFEAFEIVNIFGHDSFAQVQIGKNYYGIDTDVKRGNKLTAIELGSMRIVDVPTDGRDLADG